MVLGQISFISGTAQVPSQSATNPQLNRPSWSTRPALPSTVKAICMWRMDMPASDSISRAPSRSARAAPRCWASRPRQPTIGPRSYPTATTLGSSQLRRDRHKRFSPECVFAASGLVFVCDSPQNRVVQYSSLTVPTWRTRHCQSGFTGQQSATAGKPTRASSIPPTRPFQTRSPEPSTPVTDEMWIVDQGNNRVVAFANQGGNVYS